MWSIFGGESGWFSKIQSISQSIYGQYRFGLRIAGVTKRSKINVAVEKSLPRRALWDEVKDRLERSAYDFPAASSSALHRTRARRRARIVLMDDRVPRSIRSRREGGKS